MTHGREMPDTHNVGWPYRLLAFLVAFFGVVGIVATLHDIVDRGLSQGRLFDVVTLLGVLWLTIPMAWIAGVGRAPARLPGFRQDDPATAPVPAPPRPVVDQPLFGPETRLLDRDDFVVPNAEFGIEMLNDATTHMDFVVDQLMAHVGLAKAEAAQVIMQIHTQGGALLPLPDEAAARDAATRIADAAREAQFALVCRFVDFRTRRSS